MILNENQVSVLVANLGQGKADEIVEALRLKVDLENELKNVTTKKPTQTEISNYAFISGMMYGWASRLEKLTVDEFGKHDVETFRLISDMKEESTRLAKLAGVIRK